MTASSTPPVEADASPLALSPTIVAVATPPGQGGIGIVRLSGHDAPQLAAQLIGRNKPKPLKPRRAHLARAYDEAGELLDEGIALYFPAPHSFTGENVIEFQGHGSPVLLQLIVQRCVQLGAQLAAPGEFSQRSFLNGKLDLAQAEAIADLIESSTELAARAAMRSLQGEFSDSVEAIRRELTALRVFVEASIDFPEEEIDFLEQHDVLGRTRAVQAQFMQLKSNAARGSLLRDAVRIVLIGAPNAGKSSLLNALCRDERAIVSDIAGTTRDVLEQAIQINGYPVLLTDTAGLRDSEDVIEKEGIKRARHALQQADLALLCVDPQTTDDAAVAQLLQQDVPEGLGALVVKTKADLSGHSAGLQNGPHGQELHLSSTTLDGVDALCDWISRMLGVNDFSQGQILARQRHMDALNRAQQHIEAAVQVYEQQQAGELLAEELLLAANALGEITGAMTADDLLGEIFGSFCIGK